MSDLLNQDVISGTARLGKSPMRGQRCPSLSLSLPAAQSRQFPTTSFHSDSSPPSGGRKGLKFEALGHRPPESKALLWCFLIPHFQTTLLPQLGDKKQKNRSKQTNKQMLQNLPVLVKLLIAQQKSLSTISMHYFLPADQEEAGNMGTLVIRGCATQDSNGTWFAELEPKPNSSIVQEKTEIHCFKNQQMSH